LKILVSKLPKLVQGSVAIDRGLKAGRITGGVRTITSFGDTSAVLTTRTTADLGA
jgi:hypothetical protein